VLAKWPFPLFVEWIGKASFLPFSLRLQFVKQCFRRCFVGTQHNPAADPVSVDIVAVILLCLSLRPGFRVFERAFEYSWHASLILSARHQSRGAGLPSHSPLDR
jgi:hypothetical protein